MRDLRAGCDGHRPRATARRPQGVRRLLTVPSVALLASAVWGCLCGGGSAEAQAIDQDLQAAAPGGEASTSGWSGSRLVMGAAVVAEDEAGMQQGAAEPGLTAEKRQQLAQAAQDRALAPWQRKFMMEMARNGQAGAAGGAAANRAASPQHAMSTDGDWVQEPPPSSREFHAAIYDPLRDRMVVLGGFDGNYLNDVWVLSLTGSPVWTRLLPLGPPPSARYAHSAIYDPVRDRIVIFGGGYFDGLFHHYYSDVWALSLAGGPVWMQLSPEGNPPSARASHTAIYDPVRDRMVVFGGYYYDTSLHALDDVWELSFAEGPSWTQLTPEGTPPGARYSHTAIYDPLRDRMLVFGGVGAGISDVWALSLGGSPAWAEFTPAGVPPSARYAHTAIYDPVRDRMVVFGGHDLSGYLNDSWALALADDPAWTQLIPASTAPSGREGSAVIYDPLRDRMLVFGGGYHEHYEDHFFGDAWDLSLAQSPVWTELTPGWTPPSARLGHAAIYDPMRDRMVVFGGRDVSGDLNDVWALSLGGSPAWTHLTPLGTPPSAREDHTAIYDPVRDRMVVFGGRTATGFLPNDVWALTLGDSPAWTQLAPAGVSPSGRSTHTAIYDPVRDRMVVFGGYSGSYLNDVWTLSLGGNPAWTQLIPLGTPPSGRLSHSAIYDPVRDRMVVFGGYSGSYLNDVWTLSLGGSPAWTQPIPLGTPPNARGDHTAIYDPMRDRMVSFGGHAGTSLSTNDAWGLSLGGSPAWTQLTPAGVPPGGRSYHTAIYDPLRDRMVVFAGYDGSGNLDDVWDLLWAPTVSITPQSGGMLSLAPAYPNPARGDIAIEFTLPRPGAVTLRVYDVSGRLVRTLVEGTLPSGSHLVRWDRRLNSGVVGQSGSYFYELRVGGQKLARRIVLIK